MTANGPVYNPALTPEWRQAGGNYAVWEQIMMQKMAAQEQAAFQKQLAAYQKMLKAQGQKPPSGIDNSQKVPSITPSQRRVKKKTSLKASTTAKSKEVSRVDKSATTNQAETGTIPTVPAIKGPLNIPRSLDAVKPAKPSE